LNEESGNVAAKAVQVRRILIVDANPATARMLAELLRSLIPHCQVLGAQSEDKAFQSLQNFDPQMIFVELKGGGLDGLGFTHKLRRSYLAARETPVVIVTAEATAAAIVGARDAGVHEFLRRPFTLGDLKKRIDVIVLRPRDWVEAVGYVGPDRRRFNSADYKGPRKREAEGGSPVSQRIGQAIKIVQSAAGAISTDPKQVYRALKTQARALAQLSAGKDQLKDLERAALSLEAYLLGPAAKLGLKEEQINAFAAQLVAAAADELAVHAA
jgi:DNA-binding response OmpR family regulator